MKVKIKRVDKELPMPIYQTRGSVGCDLNVRVTTTIPPKGLARIPANIVVETPLGYMFVIASRSSTPFKKGLQMANSIGIIDQDFCGPEDECQVAVYNFTDKEVTIERGERIAQGLFVPVEVVEWEEIEETDQPTRGMFGSTGNK